MLALGVYRSTREPRALVKYQGIDTLVFQGTDCTTSTVGMETDFADRLQQMVWGTHPIVRHSIYDVGQSAGLGEAMWSQDRV